MHLWAGIGILLIYRPLFVWHLIKLMSIILILCWSRYIAYTEFSNCFWLVSDVCFTVCRCCLLVSIELWTKWLRLKSSTILSLRLTVWYASILASIMTSGWIDKVRKWGFRQMFSWCNNLKWHPVNRTFPGQLGSACTRKVLNHPGF